MKFVTYENKQGEKRAGWIHNENVIDIEAQSEGKLPNTMMDFLMNVENFQPIIEQLDQSLNGNAGIPLKQVKLCAPVPNPSSIRDFYAFEEHVKTARKSRGLDVIPEWYEIPVFYFTNHRAVVGPADMVSRPQQCEWLDYELEIACVIGKEGKNIKASEAEDYIFGYMIMNDWSARDLQKREMKVGLGPAKGKDFATSFGPYLVTKDELESYRINDRYDLEMTAKVNGKLLSRGNMSSIYYSFGDMIERASQDVTLYPGDIIGSGTVGSGCILELGTEIHRWLEPGDMVELEIKKLGSLVNQIK